MREKGRGPCLRRDRHSVVDFTFTCDETSFGQNCHGGGGGGGLKLLGTRAVRRGPFAMSVARLGLLRSLEGEGPAAGCTASRAGGVNCHPQRTQAGEVAMFCTCPCSPLMLFLSSHP